MPPKAKAAPAGAAPTLEDEVAWPEGVATVPDPTFYYAITHVYSHVFKLEGLAEADGLPPLREFDPCAQMSTAFKEDCAEDPVARRIVAVDRDELQSLAEGGSLAHGLKVKAERESVAKKRRKINNLRNKVIAAHEAAEAKAAAEKARREAAAAVAAERAAKMAEHEAAVASAVDAGQEPPEAPVFEDPPEEAAEEEVEDRPESEKPAEEVDFVLVVFGYPETDEEFQALREDGIFDVPDMWASVYLSGQTIREEPHAVEDSEEVEMQRVREICGPPAILRTVYDAIQGAELNGKLASGAFVTINDGHKFAPPAMLPEGADSSAGALVAEMKSSIMSALSGKAERRKAYEKWAAGVSEKEEVPSLRSADCKLYMDLLDSVDPSRHDIPLLLHCMCEQVAHSLSGDQHDGHGPCGAPSAAGGEDEELSLLDIYLEDVHKTDICGNFQKDGTIDGTSNPAVAQSNWKYPGGQAEDADSLILPVLDQAGCKHVGDELPGHVSVDEVVHRIWSHVQGPGIRRSGLPEVAPDTPPRRCAKRNRIYSMIPDLPIVVFEKLLLLNEFERLLSGVQPEREWRLHDRIFHERIPKELLVQVLIDGFQQQECFIASSYVPRHDCLIIALYHRSLPARMVWHRWAGDHLAPSDAQVMRTTPTFNDWCLLVAPSNESGMEEFGGVVRRPKLLALDGREMGYCKVLEKIFTPSDKSVILRTRLHRGLASILEPAPEGCDLPPEIEVPDVDDEAVEEEDELQLAEGLGDNVAKKPGHSGHDPAQDAFEPPPRYENHSVRILKDNFTFGIVSDKEWETKKPGFRELRKAHEQAKAEAAAAAAAAAAEEAARRAEEEGTEGADPALAAANATATEAAAVAAETPDGDEQPSAIMTEKRLEGIHLGIFWLVFRDGARCTCRVQHERPFWPEGSFLWDVTEGRPGMLFTYSPVIGLPLQVFSDGSVRETWPADLRGSKLAGNLQPQSSTSLGWPGADKLFASGVLPGGPEDCEVARTVTPFGTIVRELLSGRREIYHSDGTCAVRNPTVEELRAECDKWRLVTEKEGPAARNQLAGCPRSMRDMGGPLGYLEAVILAVEQLHGSTEQEADPSADFVPPSETSKSVGIPGHWRVIRPDGTVYGRTVVPPPPPAPEPEVPAEEDEVLRKDDTVTANEDIMISKKESVHKGTRGVIREIDGDGDAHVTFEGKAADVKVLQKDLYIKLTKVIEGGAATDPAAAEDAEAEEGTPPEEAAEEGSESEVEPPPAWEDTYAMQLGGFLVDHGKVVEYPIAPLSTTLQLDPHTNQRIATNAEGLVTYEEADGNRRVCLHADGSRLIWERSKDSYRVSVEKERAARVTCEVSHTEYDPCASMTVECVDGTKLEVVPRCPNLKAELVPSDPGAPNPLEASTNASVLLRRRDGTIIYSRGAGEINIASGFDVMARTEKEALRLVETPGLYTAFCTEDCIKLGDEDGNFFEVHGDQTVQAKLAVSMGDEYQSPRCVKPNTPYRHPHSVYLPLPEDVPDPRLIVVYGDGEAEELLLTRDAQEALRLAKQDANCCVVEGEILGPPMDYCACHTIFRSASSDKVSVPPLPITLPPSISGFFPGLDAFAPSPASNYTEFRQFVEYPAITDAQREKFLEALAQFEEREERHRAQQAAYGQGLNTRKMAAVAPEVPGGA